MSVTWAEWLDAHASSPALHPVRDRVLGLARVTVGDVVLDVGAGIGLLSLEARARGATVIAVDPDPTCLSALAGQGLDVRSGSAEALPVDDEMVDAVVLRSVLIYVEDLEAAAREFARVLRRGGRLAAFEPLNRSGTYVHDVVDWSATGIDVAADDRAWLENEDRISRLDADELVDALRTAGFAEVVLEVEEESWTQAIDNAWIDVLLDAAAYPQQPSRRERWTTRYGADVTEKLIAHLRSQAGREITLRWPELYLAARL